MQINSYLFFNGNCAQAFEFYKESLGGKNLMLMPFRGSPMEQHTSEQWLDKMLHASLQIGGQSLMGSDGMPEQPYQGITGCSIALSVDTDTEAEKAFNALAKNGKITMALEPTFWASKFGMLTDQFGVSWMVMCEAKAQA